MVIPRVSVKFTDLGLAHVLDAVVKAGTTGIKVGIVGAKANEPSADGRHNNAEIGLINEFGSSDGHVPERSFLRGPLVRKNRSLIKALFIDVARRIASDPSSSAEHELQRVGEKLADIPRKAIMEEKVPPPNAEMTIHKKEWDVPLWETGRMFNAISSQLERADGGVVEEGASAEEFAEFEVTALDQFGAGGID